VENESAIHTALLLYKARALRLQGLPEAARQTLIPLVRRKKGRAPELLEAVLYERGLCSENLGDRKKARQDFEKLYALNPDYEGLREHLGL
jgi:tetratricopeptide (TPR) repeat protein